MSEPIRIVVEGPPPRKNERHVNVRIAGHGARKNSAKFESFAFRLGRAWDALGIGNLASGVYEITVHSFWPKQRHLGDVSVANGDSDAALSCVKDALQMVGAIDNDARVVGDHTKSHHDKARPRTEITLVAVSAEGYEPKKTSGRRRKAA